MLFFCASLVLYIFTIFLVYVAEREDYCKMFGDVPSNIRDWLYGGWFRPTAPLMAVYVAWFAVFSGEFLDRLNDVVHAAFP
jgi:membrane protease YdiL (CAAX protease family)